MHFLTAPKKVNLTIYLCLNARSRSCDMKPDTRAGMHRICPSRPAHYILELPRTTWTYRAAGQQDRAGLPLVPRFLSGDPALTIRAPLWRAAWRALESCG
jgi:hypothetical protein